MNKSAEETFYDYVKKELAKQHTSCLQNTQMYTPPRLIDYNELISCILNQALLTKQHAQEFDIDYGPEVDKIVSKCLIDFLEETGITDSIREAIKKTLKMHGKNYVSHIINPQTFSALSKCYGINTWRGMVYNQTIILYQNQGDKND